MYIPESIAGDPHHSTILDMMLYVTCSDAGEDKNSVSCSSLKGGCSPECVFFRKDNLLKQLLKELTGAEGE